MLSKKVSFVPCLSDEMLNCAQFYTKYFPVHQRKKSKHCTKKTDMNNTIGMKKFFWSETTYKMQQWY